MEGRGGKIWMGFEIQSSTMKKRFPMHPKPELPQSLGIMLYPFQVGLLSGLNGQEYNYTSIDSSFYSCLQIVLPLLHFFPSYTLYTLAFK